jgi:hypothetical protein
MPLLANAHVYNPPDPSRALQVNLNPPHPNPRPRPCRAVTQKEERERPGRRALGIQVVNHTIIQRSYRTSQSEHNGELSRLENQTGKWWTGVNVMRQRGINRTFSFSLLSSASFSPKDQTQISKGRKKRECRHTHLPRIEGGKGGQAHTCSHEE